MASVNKVIIVGKLGRDPETRSTPSGANVTTLNVATSETWNDNGNRQERTEWHRITVWGKQGENAAKYLSKGRGVYVEGKLQTRSWEDKDGQKKYATDIVAITVQFLDSPRRSGEEAPPPEEENLYSHLNRQSLDDIPF